MLRSRYSRLSAGCHPGMGAPTKPSGLQATRGRPIEIKAADDRMDTEATRYAAEVFSLMALLSDMP